jgi:hypothetical protein
MVLLLSAPMFAQDWTLCAQASPLRLNQGESITFGRHSSPVFWGFNRDVRYQLCTAQGRPVSRRVRLDMIIESLDGDSGREAREVVTDGRGRFSATYGAGGLQPGGAWPEGMVSRERHSFVHEGRVLAVFVLERSARNLRFAEESEITGQVPASSTATAPKAGFLVNQKQRP